MSQLRYRDGEGFIPDNGDNGWVKVGVWVEGSPEWTAFGSVMTDGRANYCLDAYRCPQCTLIQIYSPQQK